MITKKFSKKQITVLIFAMGIILALAAAVTNTIVSRADVLADSVSQAGPAAQYQITPTPTPEGISHPGSTDGIMLMGIIIVIIVLLPIVLRRDTWTK